MKQNIELLLLKSDEKRKSQIPSTQSHAVLNAVTFASPTLGQLATSVLVKTLICVVYALVHMFFFVFYLAYVLFMDF